MPSGVYSIPHIQVAAWIHLSINISNNINNNNRKQNNQKKRNNLKMAVYRELGPTEQYLNK